MSTQEVPKLASDPEVKKEEVVPEIPCVEFLRRLAVHHDFERESDTINFSAHFYDHENIPGVVEHIEKYFLADKNVSRYHGHPFKLDPRDGDVARIHFKKPVEGIQNLVIMLKPVND